MSGGYLLDTNVPSETLRPLPESRVVSWLESQAKDSQFLSVITMGELPAASRSLCQASDERSLNILWR